MYLLNLLLATGASMLFLALVFIPMEKVFPAKPGQKVFRKGWLLDLCFFFGQYLLWSGLVLYALNHFSYLLDDIVPQNFRVTVQKQPVWLQAFEVLFFSDLLIYWGHRLQHKVDFLWRFHKVHHTAEHLDWLAAHREHPLDSIYTVGIINLPAFIFGFDLSSIVAIVAFRGIWAIYIHSNVRLNIGPLRKLIGSPDLHHWHHDIERDRGNYANVSPLMDILFGTYTCPPHEPERFGIKEDFPKNYVGQMVRPLLPKKFRFNLKKGSAVLLAFLLLSFNNATAQTKSPKFSKDTIAARQKRFFKALAEGEGSTFNHYVVVKIKNLNDSTVKEICNTDKWVFEALRIDGYNFDMIKNSKTRYFALKSEDALRMIGYWDYNSVGLAWTKLEYNIDGIIDKAIANKSWRVRMSDAIDKRMLAHVLFNRGYVSGVSACFSGDIVVYPDKGDW